MLVKGEAEMGELNKLLQLQVWELSIFWMVSGQFTQFHFIECQYTQSIILTMPNLIYPIVKITGSTI